MREADSKQRNADPDDDGLPRSIFVPEEDPRKGLRDTVDSILSDRFMAFLSILLLPIILLPFFITFSDQVLTSFEIVDATVVVFFVVEYFSKLFLARNRWEHFKSPWHIVDLTVVVLSFISYLPLLGLKSKGSTSLLLRLLRLPRALAVGGRTAGSRIHANQTVQTAVVRPPETVIRQVGADLKAEEVKLTWDEFEAHMKSPQQEWIDIHNITEEGIIKLSALLRVPPKHLGSRELDEVYPHVDYVQQMSFIFLQTGEIKYPETAERYLTIARLGQIVVCRGPKIISASPHGLDIFEKGLEDIRGGRQYGSFTVSVLYGILDAALKEYRSIFSEMELEITRIGSTPRSKLPKDFLQRMYELNKEVVRLVTNLVHFKELLGVTISKRVALEGFDATAEENFKTLLDESAYLNDIAQDIVDHIRTIIDLYINQSSFETNRILKILAVITSLSVIPSAMSGILGTNLLDSPYNLDLWQLILVTGMAMAFVGYVFVKLGWLKS